MKTKFIFILVLILTVLSCKKDDNNITDNYIKKIELDWGGEVDEYTFDYSENLLTEVTVKEGSSSPYSFVLNYNSENKLESFTSGSNYSPKLKYIGDQIFVSGLNPNRENDTTIYTLNSDENIIDNKHYQDVRTGAGENDYTFILESRYTYQYLNKNVINSTQYYYDTKGNIQDSQSFSMTFDDKNNPFKYSSDVSIFCIEALDDIYSILWLSQNNIVKAIFDNDYKYDFQYTFNEKDLPTSIVITGQGAGYNPETVVLTIGY